MTAAIDVPTQVTYGKVIGRFVSYLADSADAGTVPDEVALNGTVLLDPLTVITRWPTTTPPRLAISQRALCRVINGDLCAPGAANNSNPGVWVIATDQPEGEPNVVQWRATFNFVGVTAQPGSIVFNVPTNGVVDLAMIASVPSAPGTITVVSHADAIAAAASAADAAASAAEAAALLYPQHVSTPAPQVATTQAPSGRLIIGIFGSTLIYWSAFGISQSDDGGGGITAKTVPADCTTAAATAGAPWMVAFDGYWYLSCLNNAGVASVYRTPVVPKGTPFTWSAALVTGGSGAMVLTPGLATDGTALYWAEYGDPVGGPKFQRSTDGTTWTTQDMSSHFARHIHGVFPDPYNPGHLWMTGGDAGSAHYHLRSTDYGLTWAAVPGAFGTDQSWQAVQVSFTATDVWLAPDTTSNWTVFKADRATLTPKWQGRGSQRMMPVPQGLPSRRVTDLSTTAASPTVTSATAAFAAQDAGSKLRTVGQDIVPIDTYIASVTNATTAVLRKPANAAVTNQVAILGGEAWGAMAYYGAIDPATGIYYFVTINGAAGGNVDGLFALLPDGAIVLLDIMTTSPDGRVTIDTVNSRVYVRGFYRALLAV